MSREALRIYRWMWREQLHRRRGRRIPAVAGFAGVAGLDLVRAVWLTAVRSTTTASRAVAAITAPQIVAGAGRTVYVTGFCLLLFTPLSFAFVASYPNIPAIPGQGPGQSPREGPRQGPRQGEIHILGAGTVLLDGDRLAADALGLELASRGIRTARITVDDTAPVRLLADLRGILGASGIDRVHVVRSAAVRGDDR